MKLLPVYKPGTVKKALLAFVGIGATGAVIKYKSHSEAHLQGPDLEDWQEEHGLAWYLQEALHVASGSAKGASHTLLHLLGSLRHAWAVRYVPSGSGPSAAQRMSLPVAVAEFLSSMAEESDGQGGAASRVGYVLAGYKVLDWLLDTAVANPGSPEHFAVERFLAKVLSDDEATCALLERPGAIPKLLRLVASELASDSRSSSQSTQAPLHLAWQQQGQQNEQQQLQQGNEQGQQPRAMDDDMLAEAHQASLHPLMTAVIHGGKLPMRVQQEDMQAVLVMACEPRQGRDAHLLAMQLLTALAQTSVLNCKAIAGAGGGRRLAGLAASSSTGVDVDGMQLEIARLMTTLARNCPDRGDLKMSRWLYHLLCFAADASANRNWQLAAASLQAFANCLRAGSKIQDSLMRGNALPLLHQLADWQRQQAQHAQQQGGAAGSGGSSGPLMRAAIASAVGSLVETRRERFPLAEREHWGEVLLGWMSEQPLDESLQHHELLKALAGALAGLAAIPGPDGLHIAHAWLAEMIVHLSRQIEAARPGRKAPQQQARGAAAAAGGTTPGSATGGSSGSDSTSSWWKFWAKDSPPPTGGVEAAAAAPGSLATVVDSGSEEVSALAEAAAVVEFEAELPPGSTAATERASASSSSSSGDGAGQPVGGEQQAYEDGWGSNPWWKPWGSPGGGSKQGDSPSPMQAAAGSAGPAAGSAGPSAAAAAGGGRESAAAEALVRRPTSDPELSEFLRAAPVGPLYARSVAAELLEASGRVGSYQEPPPDAEELMSPDAIAAYAKVAAAVDMEVADKALCQALKVLCALVSGDADKQRWVRLVGVLPLLHRLTIGHPRDIPEVTDPDYFSESLPLCVRRQSARLLAMLTADLEGARAVRKGGWVPWLQNVAASSDCKISSCAARALLHLESAAALQRHALALRPPWQLAKQLKRSALPPLLPGPEPDPEGDVLEEARQRLQAVRRRLDRQLDAVRPPVPPQHRLVMSDGVHLFDPLATHHETLAREGTDSQSTDAPLVDVVFVHGIRGGAFATWRREGVLQHGQARENLERDTCWPGAWLAKELPEARLLTVEYPAPASGWEGESLPLTHTAVRLMDKLAAAGVGNRPVIFVAHSMGGLVVKELLARASADDSARFHGLAQNARGAVFYSVPHFGAKLAAYGWQLRYVGGSPAAAVEQLRPGPHLDAINSCVKAMYKSGRLPVLSFSEGLQTRLGYMKASIVPHESAFPGYGEFVVLSHHDHINVCKPLGKDDPAYAKLADFLKARVEEVRAEVAEQIVESMDGLEPAV